LKQEGLGRRGQKWEGNVKIYIAQVVQKDNNSILCFFDRASRYICLIKINLMHYLSSVYFVNQPLHVSGISLAHHQKVCCIYTTIGTVCCPVGHQSTDITTRTNCCIYTVYHLIMGYRYARNM
jgi:hypothetical protein